MIIRGTDSMMCGNHPYSQNRMKFKMVENNVDNQSYLYCPACYQTVVITPELRAILDDYRRPDVTTTPVTVSKRDLTVPSGGSNASQVA